MHHLKDPNANSIYYEAKPFVMDAIYSCDVDTKEQLKIAESLCSSISHEFSYLLDV